MTTRTFGLGRVGAVHQGAWSATEQYRYLDTLYHTDGVVYINIHTGITPVGTLPTDTDYWDILVPNLTSAVAADVAALTIRAANLETRATSLETRTADHETRLSVLEKKIVQTPFVLASGLTYTQNDCHYFKDNSGIVTMNIRLTSITFATTTTILGTLPEGYRPARNTMGVAVYNTGTTRYSSDCGVTTAGTVSIYGVVGAQSYYTASITYPAV